MTPNAIPFKNYDRIVTLPGFFSDSDIDLIEQIANKNPSQDAAVKLGLSSFVKPDIRSSKVVWLEVQEETAWLYNKVMKGVTQANDDFFHCNISGTDILQYAVYQHPSGFYGPHIDEVKEHNFITRKISLSIQLTDENLYEGGDLLLYPGNLTPFKASRGKGDMVLFLSSMVHEVTPVTSGCRHSLVTWIYGPHWV